MDYDLVMEERNELMVSPAGGESAIRRAHFLRPTVTSVAGPAAAPSLSYPAAAGFKDLPLDVSYQGCRNPPENWKAWVDRMHELHNSTWKNAGIVDAIMNSKCIIHDLIFGFSEKWCSTTNTFVFPWGEASVTLEDTMVLGGYPVLGEGVSNMGPPRPEEIQRVVMKLQQARAELNKSSLKKAGQGKWMTKFMGSGNEIEHEAFLCYWLSRFVFPSARDTIPTNVVAIAAHLARGSKIALAPAVLSSIYKGLSLLKAAIVAATKSRTGGDGSIVQVEVPGLALVQVWIWERFPSLRPKPEPVGLKPGLARWHDLKLGSSHRSLTLESAGKDFQWRPYTNGMIYGENELWAKVGSDLDEDLMAFVRCLRGSELVGLDGIEQYLPHRVAMQFGIDQDIPGHVARVNVNPGIAWNDFNRSIRDAKIYVPSRLSQPSVTARYSNWWKKLNHGWSGKTTPWVVDSMQLVKNELFADDDDDDDDVPPPPGFSRRRKGDDYFFPLPPAFFIEPRRVEDRDRPSSSKNKSILEDDFLPRPPCSSPKRRRVGDAEKLQVPPKDKEYEVISSSDSIIGSEKRAARNGNSQLDSEANIKKLAKGKAKCEDRVDEKIVTSGSNSKYRALGEELEQKIMQIEKLVTVLKAESSLFIQ